MLKIIMQKNEVWFIWLYGMSDSLVRAVIEVWNTKPLVAIIILLRMKSNKCFMGSYKAGLPERLYSSYNDVKFVGMQLLLQSSWQQGFDLSDIWKLPTMKYM